MRAHQIRNLARIAEYTDQVDSQLQGTHQLRYSICPHAGRWPEADLVAEAQQYLLPPLAAQAGRCTGTPAKPLPPEHSFCCLSLPNVKLAALKRSEDGSALICRLVNPEGRTIELDLALGIDVAGVRAVLADEKTPAGEGVQASVDGRTVRVRLGAKKIGTLRLEVPG